MSDSFLRNGPRLAARIACAGLMGALLAGCSSDATRFSDAFSNPFASGDQAPQPQRTAQAAPVRKVQSAPLPAPAQVSARPVPTETTAAIGPQGGSAAGWTAAGGSPIVVAQGENVNILSQRYGVPAAALLQVNGFSSAAQVKPGARIVIPVYNAGAASVPAAKVAVAAPAAPKVAVAAPKAAVKVAEPKVAVAVPAVRAHAGAQVANTHLAVPAGVKTRVAVAVPAPKVVVKTPAVSVNAHVAAPVVAARVQAPAVAVKAPKAPVQMQARVAAPTAVAVAQPAAPNADTTAAIKPAAAAPAASAQAAEDARPEFRMPAPGRVIEGFKPGTNDGINIAVPEGTPVKAAEAGTVIYSGSELKGYGNLVLIRHPNGFTTAYANNGELDVKRGDTVKRGQTIAKSGQTGNVASPQLHFELRKGSQPVDPSGYVAGM